MAEGSKRPHRAVVRRMPAYWMLVRGLRSRGQEWASSLEIGKALGMASSSVRRDFEHLCSRGVSRRGYELGPLEDALRIALRLDATTLQVIVVGAGPLGQGLLLDEEFPGPGLEICGVFDAEQGRVGKEVGGYVVRDPNDMSEFVRDRNVSIGIVAVPITVARVVAFELAVAGVRGILNLTPVHLREFPGVVVVDARLLTGLQELSHLIGRG